MKEVERQVMCVLLQTLRDKKLISQDVQDKARIKVLDALEASDFFCYDEEAWKEGANGHTQSSD